jgi:hypothetical protein
VATTYIQYNLVSNDAQSSFVVPFTFADTAEVKVISLQTSPSSQSPFLTWTQVTNEYWNSNFANNVSYLPFGTFSIFNQSGQYILRFVPSPLVNNAVIRHTITIFRRTNIKQFSFTNGAPLQSLDLNLAFNLFLNSFEEFNDYFDALNYLEVNTELDNKYNKSGGGITGNVEVNGTIQTNGIYELPTEVRLSKTLSMENGIIKNVTAPSESHHVVNKNYVDSLLLAFRENFSPINTEQVLSFSVTGDYTTANIAGTYTKTINTIQPYQKLIDANFIYSSTAPPTELYNFIGFPSAFNGLWILGRSYSTDENTYYRYYAHAPMISGQPSLLPVSGWVSTLAGYNSAKLGTEGDDLEDYVIQNNFQFQTSIVTTNPLEVDNNSINSLKLRKTTGDEAVTTETIRNSAVVNAKIADATILGSKIGFQTIENNNIQINSIGGDKLANLGVLSSKIGNSAVITDKINNLAVTTEKINDLAVTTGKIANLAVTPEKIANNSITSSQINSISGNKIIANTLLPTAFESTSYLLTHTPASAGVTSKVESTASLFKCNAFEASGTASLDLNLQRSLQAIPTSKATAYGKLEICSGKIKSNQIGLAIPGSEYQNSDLVFEHLGTDASGYATFNIVALSSSWYSSIGNTATIGIKRGSGDLTYGGNSVARATHDYGLNFNGGALLLQTASPIPFNAIIQNDLPELSIIPGGNDPDTFYGCFIDSRNTGYETSIGGTNPISKQKKYLITLTGQIHNVSGRGDLGEIETVFFARIPSDSMAGTSFPISEVRTNIYLSPSRTQPTGSFSVSSILTVAPNTIINIPFTYFMTHTKYNFGAGIATKWGGQQNYYDLDNMSSAVFNNWLPTRTFQGSTYYVGNDIGVQAVIQRIK